MSRLQLNTYSKAILLMHRNGYVCNRPKDETMSAFDFFKYLLVSRQFLHASQLYRVYQFAIFAYCRYDNKFYVSTEGRKAVGGWATHFKYQYEYAKEFSAVSRFFTGPIALCLSRDIYNTQNHGGIIKQVQKQLYSFRGNAKSLYISLEVPQLNLAYSNMDIESPYQLKMVLTKHRIKKVVAGNDSIYSPRFDATIGDNFFDNFPTCPSVEKLILRCKDLDENHDLISKLTKMLPFFPNLVESTCYFVAEHYTPEQFSLQKLVNWIREECSKIKELQKAWLSTTEMLLDYRFKIRKPESKKVVKQLVKEILKTTKFSHLGSVEPIIPKSSNDENNVLIKQHCSVELWRSQPNCFALLLFTVDLDSLTLDDDESEDESREHDNS